MTARRGARGRPATSGLRIVLDARPLQAPSRNPTTATYLHELLRGFAEIGSDGDEPGLTLGDSFLFLLDTPGPDPSPRYPGLPFAGRRRLPPTRRLRAASLTLDPFLLRAASIGTALDARLRGRETSGVLHVTGGTVPIASGLPMVVTLLDLAAWELPAVYQRTVAERFGQRLRVRLLRQAERLVVASEATARATSRFLPFPRERIHVVPLAATLPQNPHDGGARLARLRDRLDLPERYLVFRAQYDARKDVRTLLRAMVAAATRAASEDEGGSGVATSDGSRGTPQLLMVVPTLAVGGGTADESEAEASALVERVEREGAGGHVRVLSGLTNDEEAALLAGARALVHPALVEGSGLPVIDGLAAGLPVVATNVGTIGDLVGKAGILVPAGDARRLAAALTTIWDDDRLHAGLARAAAQRSAATTRTWADVARETREVYVLAAGRSRA